MFRDVLILQNINSLWFYLKREDNQTFSGVLNFAQEIRRQDFRHITENILHLFLSSRHHTAWNNRIKAFIFCQETEKIHLREAFLSYLLASIEVNLICNSDNFLYTAAEPKWPQPLWHCFNLCLAQCLAHSTDKNGTKISAHRRHQVSTCNLLSLKCCTLFSFSELYLIAVLYLRAAANENISAFSLYCTVNRILL